ncbi:MAG: chemotaxis protein [Tardiphaga sp.]|uniref:methyl-accepting chemotaxis protein n=1 Tax=Tardiphaga sp. TaxID=1926292 RepID=UPI001987639A|nr:methyl-accepting chemotaxis protein [Tardiphaga sp.]MBC7583239.1 chemotaxis protein [Tardiphaga sp.]
MTNDLGIDTIRRAGMRVVCALIAALAVITGILILVLSTPGKWPAAVLALMLAAYPSILALRGRIDAAARMTVSITVVAMPVLMLFVCEGYIWQTDLHMLFFALLATASILCDWRSLAAATMVVAVYHVGFGMIVPQWVFAGNSSFARIVLHAVILLIEATTLIWVAQRIVALVAANDAQSAERQQAAAALADERSSQASVVAEVTGALGEGLTALAAGDLTREIVIDFPDDYDVLKRDFNAALTSLCTAIIAVTDSTGSIRTGSDEIAQASEDLARRTEGTAASLEQTSAALVQIEGRLRDGARTSADTVVSADRAIASVGAGTDTANVVRLAMGRVSASAKGIDAVIEGVDKIAFQTRVLAMNAAVEAGRAGDAGRGFAVVADLVSALAQRAEDEAKRARDLLTLTQTEIATAVGAVALVDQAFADITGDVDSVHALLGAMARDNLAQSAAVTEITAAVSAMDRATQQNAAMVEETSAAARNLASEVDALAAQTAVFTVAGQVRAAATRQRTVRPVAVATSQRHLRGAASAHVH